MKESIHYKKELLYQKSSIQFLYNTLMSKARSKVDYSVEWWTFNFYGMSQLTLTFTLTTIMMILTWQHAPMQPRIERMKRNKPRTIRPMAMLPRIAENKETLVIIFLSILVISTIIHSPEQTKWDVQIIQLIYHGLGNILKYRSRPDLNQANQRKELTCATDRYFKHNGLRVEKWVVHP